MPPIVPASGDICDFGVVFVFGVCCIGVIVTGIDTDREVVGDRGGGDDDIRVGLLMEFARFCINASSGSNAILLELTSCEG